MQLDTAALPVGLSRLLHRLREEGVIEAVVSTGQGFGGDYEAVNVYAGLITAREVVGADLAIVTQGPGNVGTGTEWGFSGIALAEALHAAHTLGGRARIERLAAGGTLVEIVIPYERYEERGPGAGHDSRAAR